MTWSYDDEGTFKILNIVNPFKMHLKNENMNVYVFAFNNKKTFLVALFKIGGF